MLQCPTMALRPFVSLAACSLGLLLAHCGTADVQVNDGARPPNDDVLQVLDLGTDLGVALDVPTIDAAELTLVATGETSASDLAAADLPTDPGLPDLPKPPQDTAPDMASADEATPLDLGSGDPGSGDLGAEANTDLGPSACAACTDDDPCTRNRCLSGSCDVLAAVCDDADPCTTDSCDPKTGCAHAATGAAGCASATLVFWAGFDGPSLDGFTTTASEPGIGWHATGIEAHEGAGALRFGASDAPGYNGQAAVSGTAQSPAIALPAGQAARLRAWVFLDVEPDLAWDRFLVRIDTEAGPKSIPARSKIGVPLGGWHALTVDLSAFAGSTIRIAFAFDSVDTTYNDGLGAFVDGVRVETTGPIVACAAAAGCDDGLACTIEACTAAACSWTVSADCCTNDAGCADQSFCTIDRCSSDFLCEHLAVANPLCCDTVGDCDDGVLCTEDTCTPSHVCTYKTAALPGCCAAATDCDDKDKCTIDTCTDATCAHQLTCCLSDAECKDGDDKCTKDVCLDGKCKHLGTGLPGCCTPVLLSETFAGGATDWTLTATNPPCQWQVADDATSPGAPDVLHYGDVAKGNFDCNYNAGAATSGPVSLPDKEGLQIEFDVWLDCESGTTYDAFELHLIGENGQDSMVWQKDSIVPQQAWTHIAVPIATFSGQTVQLKFDFDSNDGLVNQGAGLKIDNVQVTVPCP